MPKAWGDLLRGSNFCLKCLTNEVEVHGTLCEVCVNIRCDRCAQLVEKASTSRTVPYKSYEIICDSCAKEEKQNTYGYLSVKEDCVRCGAYGYLNDEYVCTTCEAETSCHCCNQTFLNFPGEDFNLICSTCQDRNDAGECTSCGKVKKDVGKDKGYDQLTCDLCKDD